MPTKTDRILSYLPGSFRAEPRPSALYSVVDAFGGELLGAENSLAALMQAHWVDRADMGVDLVEDLAHIGALYGLAPRDDESIEEFREHLKRYVRTFLHGTATVDGILRVSAEALGVRIAEDPGALDAWWRRGTDQLVTIEADGADAAEAVLGVGVAEARGTPELAARVEGPLLPVAGVDLRGGHVLHVSVDGGPRLDVDLAAGDPGAPVPLKDIVDRLNARMPSPVASAVDGRLALTSPTTGAESSIDVAEGESDAAPSVLGLDPRSYLGHPATAARLEGTVDLPAGIDLSRQRFLRISADGGPVAEIDVANPQDPAHTRLSDIRTAIEAALGQFIQASDGGHGNLVLTSQNTGVSSRVGLEAAAAQDAAPRVFGFPGLQVRLGDDPAPARLVGPDLSAGIDLSHRDAIRIGVDGRPPVTIHCAGTVPSATRPSEIAAAINAALGAPVAADSSGRILISSPTTGPNGRIDVEDAETSDATLTVLGIGPRSFRGAEATAARVEGTRDLAAGVDLRARHLLGVSVDGGPAVGVDLRDGVGDPQKATPEELAAAVNRALGVQVAGSDGHHLVLTSPAPGSTGTVRVEPLERPKLRRFVTRVPIIDEAATILLGVVATSATGTPGTRARIEGTRDLAHSVDLRQAPMLRLSIDGGPASDVVCAGPRPRATTLPDILAALNGAGLGSNVATTAGAHLVLASPSTGAASRVALDTPHGALTPLLGVDPGSFRGVDATGVRFAGTADVSRGVDLPAHAAVRLGIDGGAPIEIALRDTTPGTVQAGDIVAAIAGALGPGVASRDATHILLASKKSGSDAGISFAVPQGTDATPAVFGIAAPRSYQGEPALPATVVGSQALPPASDLSLVRFLRVGVDGATPADVDCAQGAGDAHAVKPSEIVAAINAGLHVKVASLDGGRLRLVSPTSGRSSQILLEPSGRSDARSALLGDAPAAAAGDPAQPAAVVGQVELRQPVDLSQRSLLRLSLNAGRPFDVDVAGAAPESTVADEVVAALNATLPGVASLTAEGKLRLTAPAGPQGPAEESRIELLALRHLEVVEYPQEARTETHTVRHSEGWQVDNDGAADSPVTMELTSAGGVAGPTIVNETAGWIVGLTSAVGPGQTVRIEEATGGLRATILLEGVVIREAGPSEVIGGPVGGHARVPFKGSWVTGRVGSGRPSLTLDDPAAAGMVRLSARGNDARVAVTVVESSLAPAPPAANPEPGPGAGFARRRGRVAPATGGWILVDAAGTTIVALRPGGPVRIEDHNGRVVAAEGDLHAGTPPAMTVQMLVNLFEVTLTDLAHGSATLSFGSVSIGAGSARDDSLVRQIGASGPSVPVLAEELGRTDGLLLPQGRSSWRYRECKAARFNDARFNGADVRFAGGGACREWGLFDESRFGVVQADPVRGEFAPHPPVGPAVTIAVSWARYGPGAFSVNLPADLPPRFGARFNQAVFGNSADSPELYEGAVTEPPADPDHLVKLINAGSSRTNPSTGTPIKASLLLDAQLVPFVPLGWQAVRMPFRKPHHLTMGAPGRAAAMYLADQGLAGQFIELKAKRAGAEGNLIAVTARTSGPAMFDVTVASGAGRFEVGRSAVLGDPAGPLGADIVRPGRVGVLQAKAGGIAASVTRDRAEQES